MRNPKRDLAWPSPFFYGLYGNPYGSKTLAAEMSGALGKSPIAGKNAD